MMRICNEHEKIIHSCLFFSVVFRVSLCWNGKHIVCVRCTCLEWKVLSSVQILNKIDYSEVSLQNEQNVQEKQQQQTHGILWKECAYKLRFQPRCWGMRAIQIINDGFSEQMENLQMCTRNICTNGFRLRRAINF